jgi:hypothetical protein
VSCAIEATIFGVPVVLASSAALRFSCFGAAQQGNKRNSGENGECRKKILHGLCASLALIFDVGTMPLSVFKDQSRRDEGRMNPHVFHVELAFKKADSVGFFRRGSSTCVFLTKGVSALLGRNSTYYNYHILLYSKCQVHF